MLYRKMRLRTLQAWARKRLCLSEKMPWKGKRNSGQRRALQSSLIDKATCPANLRSTKEQRQKVAMCGWLRQLNAGKSVLVNLGKRVTCQEEKSNKNRESVGKDDQKGMSNKIPQNDELPAVDSAKEEPGGHDT